MAKNWQFAARHLWPILTDAAKQKRTLTYSDIAPAVHTNPLNVRRALGPIMHHCVDAHLPPLTSIVINMTKGVPGKGFTSWEIDDINAAHKSVYRHDWTLVANPFSGFDEEDTIESLSRHIVDNPARSKEVYRKVKVRGSIQTIFRNAVLTAYDGRCAICGLRFKETLDAAHIIPWSKATHSQRLSPRNGLLLCANHHKLFDSRRICISEKFVVEVRHGSKRCNTATFGKSDKAATIKFHGASLRLPEHRHLWPKRKYLRRRITRNYR